MNLDLPDDVVEFATAADSAISRAGGLSLARAAEVDPVVRHVAGDVLRTLGAEELDPRSDPDLLLASAALCRVAGRFVVPFPVVSMLTAIDDRWLVVIGRGARVARVDHGDLGPGWIATDLDGVAYRTEPVTEAIAQPLAPFAADLELSNSAELRDVRDVATWLTLDAWYVLGAIERALALTVEHVTERRQFGQPLSAFQAVRFRVADCTVSVRGLSELALYTAWRAFRAPNHGAE